MMTHRERVLAAFRRQKTDRIPKWIQPGVYLKTLVKEKTGSDNPAGYLNLDIRELVNYSPVTRSAEVDEWGVCNLKDSVPPMKHFKNAADVFSYPFPDFRDLSRYKDLPEQIAEIKKRGLPAVNGYECGTFEQLWALRGMDNLLMDFFDEPEFIFPLIDRVADIKADIAQGYVRAGLDILFTGDDLGSERALLMKPELWRKFLKPAVRKIIRRAREANSDILVAFHSDGYIEPLIPDLIEAGVDILQAVQPECMDICRLKEKFGCRLAFWGTISTQRTMAFGSPEDVKREVAERTSLFRNDGGICIAPSHTLEPPTPWANVVAFCKGAEEIQP